MLTGHDMFTSAKVAYTSYREKLLVDVAITLLLRMHDPCLYRKKRLKRVDLVLMLLIGSCDPLAFDSVH